MNTKYENQLAISRIERSKPIITFTFAFQTKFYGISYYRRYYIDNRAGAVWRE
jgi:hypothetical protein